MLDADWSVCVHTLKDEDCSVAAGAGCVGSREVEVWFYTYQRLLLASQPHSRPPTVCECVCFCSR